MDNGSPTTGSIYNEFDSLIGRDEAWLKDRNSKVLGCDDSQVQARIVQRVVNFATEAYTVQSVRAISPFIVTRGDQKIAARRLIRIRQVKKGG